MIGETTHRITDRKNTVMLVEMTPMTYLTLCGLVRDALEVGSDADALLKKAAGELMGATAGGMISAELAEKPANLDALRRGGFLAG